MKTNGQTKSKNSPSYFPLSAVNHNAHVSDKSDQRGERKEIGKKASLWQKSIRDFCEF